MPTLAKFSKKVRQFVAWSFSRFQDYRECPAKAAYKHIDKVHGTTDYGDAEVDRLVAARSSGKLVELPEKTPPMVKGSVVHVLAQQFTKGDTKKLPVELDTFRKEFRELRRYTVIEEKQWAFTVDWEPCGWKDWDRAWLRVMVDAHYDEGGGKFCIIDYKTGKAPVTEPAYYLKRKLAVPKRNNPNFDFWNTEKFSQHEEQREIYAVAIFVMYPDAEMVRASHWYTDAGVEYHNTYTRQDDLERLKKKWEKAVRPMMNDRSFVPRPSPSACKFCDFSKGRGGPCRY